MLLPVFVSWPLVAIVIALLFRPSFVDVIDRFSKTPESKAEFGPIKIQMGAAALPPQYRASGAPVSSEIIDLSPTIGAIGNTGPEGSTVGFALAYAIQARAAKDGQPDLRVSPRGIYNLARKYDEYEGENYEGTSLRGGVLGASKVGVYRAEDWPYQSQTPLASKKPVLKIRSFRQVKTIQTILAELRAGNVVAASVFVPDAFDNPEKDGKVTIKLPLSVEQGSAIAIVGYDAASAEFRFANTWGTEWGDKGFGKIKDTDLIEILTDAYAVDL